jgi:hypothetical protein
MVGAEVTSYDLVFTSALEIVFFSIRQKLVNRLDNSANSVIQQHRFQFGNAMGLAFTEILKRLGV